MSGNPFFQFYPSDWLAGTRGLTSSETGVYITLIALMYEANGPIQFDEKRLARLCGATAAAFKKAVDGLVETGKLTLNDGEISNGRVEIEIKKRSEKRASASQSAKARWEKTQEKQSPSDANAHHSQCERDANQKPEPDIGKEEPNGSSKRRGTRLPDEWMPDQAFARQEGLSGADCEREADKFRDHWRSQPGQRGVKLDWAATWRNWVRNATKSAPRQRPATDWRDEPEYRNVL